MPTALEGCSPTIAEPSYTPFKRVSFAIGVAAVLLVVLPADLKPIAFSVFGVGTAIALVFHVRRLPSRVRRPVGLIAVAGGCSVTAGIVRGIHAEISGVAYPFPSPADALYILTYVIFIAAILYIIHLRVGRPSMDAALDALVGLLAAGLLQWSKVLIPYLRADGVSDVQKAVNIGFSTLTLLMIGAAVLALVAGSVPTVSNRLLALGLVATFATDMTAVLASAGLLPPDTETYPAFFVLVFAALGLFHPSVVHLVDRPSGQQLRRRLTRRRVTVLALALLTPPVLMISGAFDTADPVLLLPAVISLALTPLVVTRLGRLVRQNEEMASLESTLRAVGERLVSAESVDDVSRIVSVGSEEVLRDAFVMGGLVIDPLAADAPERSGDVADTVIRVQHAIATDWSNGPETLFELPDDESGQHSTVSLVVVQQEIKGALVLRTSRSLSEDERNAVSTLTRESAIALRAVEQTELQVKQRSEARFASLIDNSSDIVTVLDDDLTLIYVSPVATRLLGFALDHLEDVEVLRLVHPDDRNTATALIADIRHGARESAEIRLHHADGEFRWFDVNGTDLTDDPNIGGLVLNLREVSDRKLAEELRVLSEARFKALVQNSTDLVVVFDESGTISYASPSLEDALGRSVDEIVSTRIDSLFTDDDADWNAILGGTATAHQAGSAIFEIKYRNAADEVRTLETLISDLRDQPAVGGFVLNARDVTERRGMEQRLRYQATHDELTGMFNRVQVLDELDGMLGRNSGSTTVAAVLIGLDDFKEVNESLGHAVGDQLLREAGRRITELLDYGDVAARVGGDEFAVVLECSRGENQVTELVNRILTAIDQPYDIEGRELTITASAGMVFDHDRSSSAEIILRNADIAMFRAKSRGKRQIVVFESEMHAASFDRLELRGDLARAITGEQFVAHYQPVIDIETHQIVGAEALIRWNHPERGLVGPGLFIPLAEETGMIGALGEWILERACTDLARWRADYGEIASDLTISVNLSVQQLHDDLILTKVRNILDRSGLPAQRLVLEVTESTLITETDKATRTMQELRKMGMRLAVDDFGTGYSSLGYIQQFEFDVLKIDKSFIDGIEAETNAQIVAAVLELANQLKVRTIAEGIETEAQDQILNRMGCRYGQGFLYSKPVPERDFRELLVSDRARSTSHATL